MAYSRYNRSRERRPTRRTSEQAFTCRHCGLRVRCEPAIAGVQNRNHCPSCLWSRHLDGAVTGDRRSACRAIMRPIGLTTKQSRNKYARERDGELMLIHQCTGCAKLVFNRIAADDNAAALLDLVASASTAGYVAAVAGAGTPPLTAHDRDLIHRRLFGTAAAGSDQ